MAKANTSTDAEQVENTGGVRGFRSSADIENFYRFVHENGLRREAAMILDKIHSVIGVKKRRGRKAKAKKIQ